jgi:hypothetical protein
MRTIAVYRVEPFACLRALIVGMWIFEETRSFETILVSYTSPQQPVNSPESAGIPQKRRKWKTLRN